MVFWLLTFFVSTPVAIYLAFAQTDIKPYDKGINITVLVLLVLELVGGVRAVSPILPTFAAHSRFSLLAGAPNCHLLWN